MTGSSAFRPEVRRALPAVVGARFAINIALRMTYTFLPAFARCAGISVGSMSTILSVRELTALSAPFAGKASDRIGVLTVMTYSCLLAGAGLLLAMFGSVGLIIGMILFGFGRTGHQVSLNAWIGNVVAYERRGRVVGLIELTWGGAALIGLPLVGLLLGWLEWWTAFAILGVATIGFSLRLRSRESGHRELAVVAPRKPHMDRNAITAITTNGAINGAAQFLFLGHGLWLEDTYGLDTAEVGLAVVAIGTVEVIATISSSRLTDRLGKRVSMVAGASLMTAAMFALAIFSAPPLALGLGVLVIAFLGFEFAVVSAIPLISELDPGARAEMVGRSVSVATIVRAVVTLIASAIYVAAGFATLMAVATCAGVFAVLLATFVMIEPRPPSGSITVGTPENRSSLMANIVTHFQNTQLSDMKLSSQVVIEAGTSARDAVLAMANADTSCAFIMDDSTISGIFTEHDVTHRVVRSPDVWDMPVDNFMTTNPHVIDRSASALDALQTMGSGGFRNMPVVLGDGHYANVTHYDLILLASSYLQREPEDDATFVAEHALRHVDFYGMPSKVPVEVTDDTSLFDVVELMIERDRGLISVVDSRGVVVGEFTQHDVFRKVACRVDDLHDEPVSAYMTSEFASALPSTTVADGLHEMAAKRHRYLVLKNETGRSVGIVTFRDIADYFEAAFASTEALP